MARLPTPHSTASRLRRQELATRELQRRTAPTVNQLVQTGLPQGVLARNFRHTNPGLSNGSSRSAATSVLSVSATVVPGRVYEVKAFHFGIYGTGLSSGMVAEADLIYTLDGSTPVPSGTVLDQVDFPVINGTPTNGELDRVFALSELSPSTNTPVTLNVLLCYWLPGANTGMSIQMNGTQAWPIDLWIADWGLDPGQSGTVY